jgi:hypothetical protein
MKYSPTYFTFIRRYTPMILTVSDKREFIPTFNGNTDLTGSEQIKVTHDAPTMAIKERAMPHGFDMDKDGQVSTHVEIDRKKVIKAFNAKIFNAAYEKPIGEVKTDGPLKVVGDGKATVIRINNAEDLFNAPVEFDPLIDELYTYFQNLLNTKVDEKN